MASPEKLGFRERAGNYAIGGGIIAGLIGLVFSAELLAVGALGVAGGYALKKTAKRE